LVALYDKTTLASTHQEQRLRHPAHLRVEIPRTYQTAGAGENHRRALAAPVCQSADVATMADLDALALEMPQATKELSADGHPSYLVHGKLFCCHRERRKDAVDPNTGERLADVLMFRVPDLDVKELLLSDTRGIYFTTPHFDGYAAVLVRIRDLDRIDRDELQDLVADAWLTRAQKRVAKQWLAENDAQAAASGRSR
jgi:hypothetical protein